MKKPKRTNISPPEVSCRDASQVVDFQTRCEQLEREVDVLRAGQTELKAQLNDAIKRLEIFEPDWAPRKLKRLNETFGSILARSQAMANRMIVVSEVASLSVRQGAEIATIRLRDLLHVWDEPDEVWNDLASTPMVEWVDVVKRRVANRSKQPALTNDKDGTNVD